MSATTAVKIAQSVVKDLSDAAINYLRVGLELFHDSLQRWPQDSQTPLGNLGIAIELMLKAFVANNSLLLLYTGLPLEFRVALLIPERMPDSFNWRGLEGELRSSVLKTIELDECISVLAHVFPDFKKQFGAHLKFISRYRNCSVHSVLPPFEKYELDRAAYLALHLLDRLTTHSCLYGQFSPKLKELNASFLRSFDEERMERVKAQIESAKRKAKELTPSKSDVMVESWEVMVYECPVCKNDGFLYGDTDLEQHEENDGSLWNDLLFYGESFKCQKCGLKLEDTEELKLVGVESCIDRSEDWDRWCDEIYQLRQDLAANQALQPTAKKRSG